MRSKWFSNEERPSTEMWTALKTQLIADEVIAVDKEDPKRVQIITPLVTAEGRQ